MPMKWNYIFGTIKKNLQVVACFRSLLCNGTHPTVCDQVCSFYLRKNSNSICLTHSSSSIAGAVYASLTLSLKQANVQLYKPETKGGELCCPWTPSGGTYSLLVPPTQFLASNLVSNYFLLISGVVHLAELVDVTAADILPVNRFSLIGCTNFGHLTIQPVWFNQCNKHPYFTLKFLLIEFAV